MKYAKYLQWSSFALIGIDPTEGDRYLRQHYTEIHSIAQELLLRTGYQPKEIYRGILMEEDNLTVLTPHSNMGYLSFSEDRNIANHFADPNGFGAEYGINALIGNYGYVVSYLPAVSEVLFHHDFINILPIKDIFKKFGIYETEKTLDIQKEVMIMQPKQPFTHLTPKK